MKRIAGFFKWLGFLILILPAVTSKVAKGQSPRYVAMDDYVRAILANDWDAHARDSIVLERAWCLGWQYDVWAGEKAYRVTQIAVPDSIEASATTIRFSCAGQFQGHVAELHVHPPQTCIRAGRCFSNGPYAWQCLPSQLDKNWLQKSKQPFAMIQCSREATVFYFPLVDGDSPLP